MLLESWIHNYVIETFSRFPSTKLRLWSVNIKLRLGIVSTVNPSGNYSSNLPFKAFPILIR